MVHGHDDVLVAYALHQVGESPTKARSRLCFTTFVNFLVLVPVIEVPLRVDDDDAEIVRNLEQNRIAAAVFGQHDLAAVFFLDVVLLPLGCFNFVASPVFVAMEKSNLPFVVFHYFQLCFDLVFRSLVRLLILLLAGHPVGRDIVTQVQQGAVFSCLLEGALE